MHIYKCSSFGLLNSVALCYPDLNLTYRKKKKIQRQRRTFAINLCWYCGNPVRLRKPFPYKVGLLLQVIFFKDIASSLIICKEYFGGTQWHHLQGSLRISHRLLGQYFGPKSLCYILFVHRLGISARYLSDSLLLEFLESFVSSRVLSVLPPGSVLRHWLFCIFINYKLPTKSN